MTQTPAIDADAVLEGLRIVDGDAHFTEPPDLWTTRAPRRLRHRVPVQRTLGRVTAWYLDDLVFASIGGNTLERRNYKVLDTHTVQPWDQVDECTCDVKAPQAMLY